MRFDVFHAPAGGRPRYLLDVQADLLDDLPTRIVVPLFQAPHLLKAFQGLQPCFDVNGESVIMMTQDLASVPKRLLKKKIVSLVQYRDEIIGALDLLFIGF